MSAKIGTFNRKQQQEILRKNGYFFFKRKGSHAFYFNEEKQDTIMVALHGSGGKDTIKDGVFKTIIKEKNLTI